MTLRECATFLFYLWKATHYADFSRPLFSRENISFIFFEQISETVVSSWQWKWNMCSYPTLFQLNFQSMWVLWRGRGCRRGKSGSRGVGLVIMSDWRSEAAEIEIVSRLGSGSVTNFGTLSASVLMFYSLMAFHKDFPWPAPFSAPICCQCNLIKTNKVEISRPTRRKAQGKSLFFRGQEETNEAFQTFFPAKEKKNERK